MERANNLKSIVKWQEDFTTWNSKVARLTGEDRMFTWSSLMPLVNSDWVARLKEDQELKNKPLKDISARMNEILLQWYHIIIAKMDYERTKIQNEITDKHSIRGSQDSTAGPSPLVSRVFGEVHNAKLMI